MPVIYIFTFINVELFFLSIPIPDFMSSDRFAWTGPLRLSFTDRRNSSQARQTPPVGRSENLTGLSFTAPMVFRHKTLHLSLALPGKENIRKFLQLNSGAAYRSGNIELLYRNKLLQNIDL